MIDVLLATYNGEPYLKEQLDSILAQEYTDFRILIRDDGSTDGTMKIIADYCVRHADKIIDVTDGEATGSAQGNFSRLMGSATADYIAFCDQDDLWHKHKLYQSLALMQTCERYLRRDNGGVIPPILVHTDLIVADEQLRRIAPSLMRYQRLNHKKRELSSLLVQNNITGNTVLINRALADRAGVIPCGVLMHDWWLGLVAAAFGHIAFLDKQMVIYRQHGNNAVGAKDVYDPAYVQKQLESGRYALALEKTYEQAALFLSVYGDTLPPKQRELVEAYAGMKDCKRNERLSRTLKYGFWKQGLGRRLGQIALM